jgi:hypothetical protein
MTFPAHPTSVASSLGAGVANTFRVFSKLHRAEGLVR